MLAVILAAAGTSGCGSSTARSSLQDPSAGPINTGTFPNLNVPPQTAATQLSPEDSAALRSELGAAQSAQAAAGAVNPPSTTPEQVKAEAAKRQAAILEEIEGR